MNYKIITNKDILQNFINWLPDTPKGQQFYICLFARKKYLLNSFLTNDKSQLKRVCASKDRIFQKIKQMECEIGNYTHNDNPIPNEALALYITPNTRDLVKAGLNMMKEIAQKTIDGVIYNPHSLAMNCIQNSCTNKKYFDIDIDYVSDIYYDELVKSTIKNHLNEDCLTFIKTRGGIHCLVELSKIDKYFANSWYKNVVNSKIEGKFDIMMNSDGLLPCPGTNQGSFTPNFI